MKICVHSLRFRVGLIIFLAFLMASVTLSAASVYATKIVLDNAADANAQLLDISMHQVDEALGMVENYWVAQLSGSDVITLATIKQKEQYYLNQNENEYTASAKAEIDYYTTLSSVSKEMESMIASFDYIDDMFLYASEKKNYLDAGKIGVTGVERALLKKELTNIFEDEFGSKQIIGKWHWIKVGENYYIIRAYKFSDIYMGAWLNVSRLLSAIRKEGYVMADTLTLFENNGKELGSQINQNFDGIQIPDEAVQQRFYSNGEKYLVISQPSARGDFSIVAVLHESSILEGLAHLKDMIIVCAFCLIVFLLFIIKLGRYWIWRPAMEICESIQKFSAGDWDVRMGKRDYCEEFTLIAKNFDGLVENIKNLKMDVYEEKIQRQKAKLQYLKLQVNPHFYINCLNVINNLSIMNRNDLVQNMTRYLGNHLRYTLEGNTVDSLEKEVNYVRNYIHIQELRFPDALTVYMEVEPNVMSVKVPPLIIQTFVENTVKYQVVGGEHTELYIVISRCEEEKHRVRIEIWDSGEGFPEDILAKLQNQSKIVDEKGEHYGIRNVCERLDLIYHGAADITFDNHWETGGAYTIIELPEIEG